MRGKFVRRDRNADEIADVLGDMAERIRDLEQAAKGSAMSIEDGALDVYDDDDVLRGRVGRQEDGGFAVKVYGKTPEVPTEPDVIPVPGGCIVEWDGTFEDAQVDDIQRVAIHVGTTANFAVVTGNEGDNIDEDTQDEIDSDLDVTEKAAILSPRGGSAFLALDPGTTTHYVRLTAIAHGGAESAPSASAEVITATSETAFHQDFFTLSKDGPQQLQLTFEPVVGSEHLYWNGIYQREDKTWNRIRRTVDLTAEPYPPKTFDRVVVEYAYLTGEQPDDRFSRGTPTGAWLISERANPSTWTDTYHISFEEPVLTEHYGPLLYTGGGSDLNNHSLKVAWFAMIGGQYVEMFTSYTNRGIPYTGWGEGLGNSGGDEGDPHIFRAWSLYHSLTIEGDEHPHNLVGCQVWPYRTGAGGAMPPIGTTNAREGQFWLGPRIAGKPRPWRNFGRP